MSQDPVFENALSLPQADRADLAFLLLESLEPPGVDVRAEQFGDELRRRVTAYRRGEIDSMSLEEARAEIERRLSQDSAK